MASKQSTVDFLSEQIADAGMITSRKMFGEYALYCNQKVVAFVCDDKLFLKPTDAGRDYIGNPLEEPAYPGSKLYFRIAEDHWDNAPWMTELVRITTDALPPPKPKKHK